MPLPPHVMDQFESWLAAARETALGEPTAMTLATADPGGRPTARVVLLREHDPRGFVFYTNADNSKGDQLRESPRAALCFYWDPLGRQIRIQGSVEPVSPEQSDAYWARRPRGSQVAAYASRQSQVLESREALAAQVAAVEQEFAGRDVPRPDHWHGFRVVADRIEFWESRPSRMHHREVYRLDGQQWVHELLYP